MSSLVDELYRQLNEVVEQLMRELGQPVSMREALLRLVESMRLEPSDFSWSWRINETSTKTAHNRNSVPSIQVTNKASL